MHKDKIEEYQAIVSSLPDITLIITESGDYADVLGGKPVVNQEASKLIGRNLLDVMPTDKALWFLDKIKETLSINKRTVCEYSISAREVKHVEHEFGPTGATWFEANVTPLKSLRNGERAVVWVARNITERYELQQKLTHLSEIDPLSGIYNRRVFFTRLEEALYNFQRYQEHCSLLLFDIDNFKTINDGSGHLQGDAVIKQLAQLCKQELRLSDVVARVGGDEFGILFKDGLDNSLGLASRLNRLVTESSDISISIGVSHFKTSDETIDQIYQRADEALYKAKLNGKNQSVAA